MSSVLTVGPGQLLRIQDDIKQTSLEEVLDGDEPACKRGCARMISRHLPRPTLPHLPNFPGDVVSRQFIRYTLHVTERPYYRYSSHP